jgi:DNA gyrase/topoisomerase IV subunit B
MEPSSEPIEFDAVVRALLVNALEEAKAGHAAEVAVELGDDAVRVTDDGRGLPIHAHPQSGRPLVEVILTGPRRGPANTLARVNAHCLWLEVETHAGGATWFQRYEAAKPEADLVRRAAARRGTAITAAPALGGPPSFEALRDLAREALYQVQVPKVRLRLKDARSARDETITVA